MHRKLTSSLFLILALALRAKAQPIQPHTQHYPNISHMLTTYGLSGEPSNLTDSIKQWIGGRFDMTLGPTVGPKDGKTWWVGYTDMAAEYAGGLYQVQDVATENGFVFENMLLHTSVDIQYRITAWKDIQQFDAFETSTNPGSSLAAIHGVFTYSSGAYTDVTVKSYSGSTFVTVSDSLYVGYMEPFDQMNFVLRTGRSGGQTTYQYWNGSAWNALTPQSDSTNGLSATGRVYFYPPADWAPTVVNGSKSKYWVRVTVSGAGAAPAYTKLFGDDWSVSSGTNNGRGWDNTVPACPSPVPAGTACRMNIGGRMEYDPYPPANASAKFRYQARAAGLWGANNNFGNPSDIQKGVRTWGRYLSAKSARIISSGGYEGIAFDDGGTSPASLATAPANPLQYTDYNHATTFDSEVIAMYREVRNSLHAIFGTNFQVGTNTTDAMIARAGDWNIAESWRYAAYSLGLGLYSYSAAAGAATYDAFLPANNPGGTKSWLLCYDAVSALNPGAVGTSWHYWDRSNRSPIGCLAQHYIGSNPKTGFTYYSQGGFVYGDTDEVYTYSPATTLMAGVAIDSAGRSKTISLSSAAGCSPIKGGFNSGRVLLRLGTPAGGDTVTGTIAGTTITTNSTIFNSYPAGSPAYCIQSQHQSQVNPSTENVWAWGTWFPAMQVDLGPPDSKGLNGGARITPWKTGGAPDYVSGQTRATCDAAQGNCADVWRRDFTKAIVLMRTWQRALDSELETPSASISLGGVYYPLKADGTTGPGVSSVRLRGSEAAILMKQPLAPTALGPSPLCDPGPQQTFRAGYAAALDGTASAARDGGPGLEFQWQQLSGPTRVRWSSRSAPLPTVHGLVFGSYEFQLTVTDSSGQASACTVKHGAVATDNNGVVITNNPVADVLLGPLPRLGSNPWPWFDTLNRADADLQSAFMDEHYPAWWDTAKQGTVTVSPGSQTVVGQSTAFTTTFCQGAASPRTPKPGAVIAVWYATGLSGQTGRRMLGVTGCVDDLHLTTDDAWDTTLPTGAALSYSADDSTSHHASDWGWGQAESPGNYYDNVAAYYALYYRSGIDDYLAAAQKLADRFWHSPMIDRGKSLIPGHSGRYGYAARSLSGLGLNLRAHELEGTEADMWPGLRTISDAMMQQLNGTDKNGAPGLWDTSEEAAHLAMVSYCALFDPDVTHRSTCKTAVSNSFANIWTPSQGPNGTWPHLFYTASSWDATSSATLATGLTTVTGSGTSWNASDFPATIWFTNQPANRPPNNYAGDARVYTASFVDATHLILDQPYEGTSGAHGWAMAPGKAMLGWGVQPATIGLLASAFDLAAKALADTYPREAGLATQSNEDAANWIATYGYWPASKGLYAYAQGINCQAPVAENNTACTGGNTADAARALSATALRAVMRAYAENRDSRLRDLGDSLYNAMFAKPGTCPAGSSLCVPDGVYLIGMDYGGHMMTGAPPEGNTWLGMFFGFNNLANWPAYRQGGLQTATNQTAYVTYDVGGIRGAAKARLRATAPNGSIVEVECGTSPCAVPLDGRQGKYLIEVQYVSATGKILATTQFPL